MSQVSLFLRLLICTLYTSPRYRGFSLLAICWLSASLPMQLVMSSPFPNNPLSFSCQLSLRIYPPAESSCQEEQISLRVRSTLRDGSVVVTLFPATSHSHSASPFLLRFPVAPPPSTWRALLNLCSQVACLVELSRRVRNGYGSAVTPACT